MNGGTSARGLGLMIIGFSSWSGFGSGSVGAVGSGAEGASGTDGGIGGISTPANRGMEGGLRFVAVAPPVVAWAWTPAA